MSRKETSREQRHVLPARKHASSGLRSVLRRLAEAVPDDDRVRAELLRLVYAAAPAVLTANLANGAMVVLVLWSIVPPRLLIGWYALLCIAVVVRTWLWRRHRRERPRPEQVARLGRIVTIGSGSSGMLWGAAWALFFVPGSPIHEIVLAFVLGGMGAGAAVALAANRSAFLAYLVPSVLPFAFPRS